MDIPNGRLFRFAPAGGTADEVLQGPVLGGATVQRDGGLALFGVHGAVLSWRDGTLREHLNATPGVRGTRFNDAIADPLGRVLSGSMPTGSRKSALYLFERDGTSRTAASELGQSNGMAFSADNQTLYHADTRLGVVCAYAYDAHNGVLGGRRVITEFVKADGVPDGMALDEEGCLWVALWGGGCVVRVDAHGRRIDRISLPVRRVSSVAFGGDDLRDVYITTAGGDDRQTNGPLAGALFRTRVNTSGLPRHLSALFSGNGEPSP